MKMFLYIVPPNSGYSGRLQQAKTLTDICEGKGASINIKVLSKNTIYSIFTLLVDFHRYEYIFVAGSKKFAFLLPFLKLTHPAKKFIYQSTSVGYDDPATIYRSRLLRFLFGLYYFHIAQIPVKGNTNQNAILVPNYVSIPNSLASDKRVNNQDAKRGVLVGAICERKGQLRFLDVISDLGADDYSYSIIGPDSGFFESVPKYSEKFKKTVAGLHNVVFRGMVPQPKVIDEFCSCDFIICASLQEGASNAYLEAIACGLTPVVLDKKSDTLLFDMFGFHYIYFKDFIVGEDLSIIEIESNFRLVERLNSMCLEFYEGL